MLLARAAVGLWAGAIFLSAPYLPRLRDFLDASGTGGFRLYLGSALLALLAGAMALALGRSRGKPGRLLARLCLLAAAVGVLYPTVAAPDSATRFIEAAHFGEYGVLAVLACRAISGQSTPLARALHGFAVTMAVAVVDESMQWVLPSRTAELRDIALNGLAGVLGVGYAWAVFGPFVGGEAPTARKLTRRETRQLGLAGSILILALGLFVQAVHGGQLVRWDGLEFKSMFSAQGLDRLAADRRARWSSLSPTERRNLSRPDRASWGIEDFYLTEALRHIHTRNEAAARGDVEVAAAENLLLERWYEPCLEVTDARRGDLGARVEKTYRSGAMTHLWPWLTRLRLWGVLLAGELVLVWLSFLREVEG